MSAARRVVWVNTYKGGVAVECFILGGAIFFVLFSNFLHCLVRLTQVLVEVFVVTERGHHRGLDHWKNQNPYDDDWYDEEDYY